MCPQKPSLDGWTKLWQPAGLSSHWTTALADRWYLLLVLIITLLHFVFSATIPLTDDELYYWSWAQQWQTGYYDHPPLVAYLISVSTSLFGNGGFGIRFFACFISTAILILLGWLAGRKKVMVYVLFTPIFVYGSVLMTPDIPFMLAWLIYLVWLGFVVKEYFRWSEDPVARVYRRAPVRIGVWAVGGVILGLGLMSKYTMLMVIPLTLLTLYPQHRVQSWIIGFTTLLGVGFAVGFPIVAFNFEHDFAPFMFQWSHGMHNSGFSWDFFSRFFTSQAALVGLLPFFILVPLLIHRRHLLEHPKYKPLYIFFLVPFLFVMYRASRTYVEANWALMSYLALWPLAQHLIDRASFKFMWTLVLWISFAVPVGVTALISVHSVSPADIIQPHQDRLTAAKVRNDFMAEVSAKLLTLTPIRPVFATTYQDTAQLRYRGIAANQVPSTTRPSEFTLVAQSPCQYAEILLFSPSEDAHSGLTCFTKQEVLYTFPIEVRGEIQSSYKLTRLYNP